MIKYISAVRQNMQPNIKPEMMYPTDDVYRDYENYVNRKNITLVQKHVFGKIAKSNGIIHKRISENSRLLYKYMIPPM